MNWLWSQAALFESPQFSWEDVDCFIRPQMLRCNQLLPGAGNLLLFNYSFYRTHLVAPYFSYPDFRYFDFLSAVFSNAVPFKFQNYEYSDLTDLSEKLTDYHANTIFETPVIVPANVRDLFYYQGYQQQDWAHYFIVTGYNPDTELFSVFDNLHLQADSKGTEYGEFTFPATLLFSCIDRFIHSHCRDGVCHEESLYKFPKLWSLAIESRDNDLIGWGPVRFARQIMSDWLRLSEELADGSLPGQDLEAVFCQLFMQQSEQLTTLTNHYLMTSNFRLAMYRVLLWSIAYELHQHAEHNYTSEVSTNIAGLVELSRELSQFETQMKSQRYQFLVYAARQHVEQNLHKIPELAQQIASANADIAQRFSTLIRQIDKHQALVKGRYDGVF